MHTTKLLKYFWKLRYLVLHEIAEFGYCFTLIWNSTKVKLKHFIWDFVTKKIGSSLPKYSVVNKLWEATEKVLREDNICAKSFARTWIVFLEWTSFQQTQANASNCFQEDWTPWTAWWSSSRWTAWYSFSRWEVWWSSLRWAAWWSSPRWTVWWTSIIRGRKIYVAEKVFNFYLCFGCIMSK